MSRQSFRLSAQAFTTSPASQLLMYELRELRGRHSCRIHAQQREAGQVAAEAKKKKRKVRPRTAGRRVFAPTMSTGAISSKRSV
jgi:hypothetical protein